jgi:uncharacterized protein with HEPN domain
MSRNLALYLTDILLCIDKIQKYTSSLNYDQFIADEKTLDAVTHNLMIIGEATKKIPSEIRIKYSQIEWQKIAGLRDFIAHAYFSINKEIVWNIVETKLDELKTCIEAILYNENLEI